MPDGKPTIRCTDCATEFSDAETEGMSACPACGSDCVPCSIDQDVTLKINWHELRILTIWASNFAAKLEPKHQRTINAIVNRLHAQHPERTPLTMAGEFKELSRSHDVEVLHSDGTTEKFQKIKPS